MKKIIIFFLFIISTFSFSIEKPEYIFDIQTEKWERGDEVVVKFIVEDRIPGYYLFDVILERMAESLLYVYEEYKTAKEYSFVYFPAEGKIGEFLLIMKVNRGTFDPTEMTMVNIKKNIVFYGHEYSRDVEFKKLFRKIGVSDISHIEELKYRKKKQ